MPLTLGCFIFVNPLATHVSGCLIFVSPVVSHLGALDFFKCPCFLCWGALFSESPRFSRFEVLYFYESPCFSLCGALFLCLPVPFTSGYLIFVSALATHVGVLDICESPHLWGWGSLFRDFSCPSRFWVLDFCESLYFSRFEVIDFRESRCRSRWGA